VEIWLEWGNAAKYTLTGSDVQRVRVLVSPLRFLTPVIEITLLDGRRLQMNPVRSGFGNISGFTSAQASLLGDRLQAALVTQWSGP
jgi:hypothetical protein